MRIREYHARKRDPDGVHGMSRSKPFATIDPGADGAMICFVDRRIRAVVPLQGPASMTDAAWVCAHLGVRTLIVEDQFLAKDVRASVRLARAAGRFVGMVGIAADVVDIGVDWKDDMGTLAGLDGPLLEVVWVLPDRWQRAALGLVGSPKRAERKARAIALADRDIGEHPRYRAAADGVRSGIADAYGLLRWWLGLGPNAR